MIRKAVLIALACAALGSCGGKKQVGSESLLNFKDQAQQRLGQATPTPVATVTPVPSAGQKAAVAAATAAPKQGQDRAPAIVVTINSAGTSFDPSVVRVYVGSSVQWVNRDSKPRSVEADTGQFSSGLIEPGATWSWTATAAGTINYHDGTRPYAVASIQVLQR